MPTKDEIFEFSEKIHDISIEYDIPLMEAVIQYCDETGLEVEIASTLLSHALKAAIREEAQALNLLKATAKLPL